MNKPLISIFMPVYNGAHFLKETIESVLNQTYKNLELICVDDGSTDDSCSIIEDFSRNDNRIILLKKKNEGNVAFSWNFVLPHVKGQYVCYISQDDLFSKDLIELQYNRILETGADAVLPDVIAYKSGSKNTNGYFGINGRRDVILTGKEACVYSLNWTIHGFALWKTDVVKRVVFCTETLNGDEFTVRKLFYSCSLVAFSLGVFYYRQDNPLAITKKPSIRRFEYLETNKMILDFLEKNSFTESEKNIFRSYAFVELITLQLLLYKNRKYFSFVDFDRCMSLIKKEYAKFKQMEITFKKYSYLKKILLCNNYFLFCVTCKTFVILNNIKRRF